MQLSERLKKVASMVTDNYCLADVGTDHGYVPIYLYTNHRIPRAIAMDVNSGPLERAKIHIGESGLSEVIETRLSDGLEALQAGEADTILIAGMGGRLITRILSMYPEVTAGAKELVLQPQSEVSLVRQFLCLHGYEIVEEHMILEEEKFYPMMRAVYCPAHAALQEWELIYGRLEVLKEKDTFWLFLQREQEKYRQVLETLQNRQTEKSIERAGEIQKKLAQLQQVSEQLKRVKK